MENSNNLPKREVISCTIIKVQDTKFGISVETDAKFTGFNEAHEIGDKTNFVWSCHRMSKEFSKVSLTLGRLLSKGRTAEESTLYISYLDFVLKGAKIQIIREFVPAGTNSLVEYDTYSTSLVKLCNEAELVQNLLNPLFKEDLEDFRNGFKAISEANEAIKLDVNNV